LRKIPVSRRNLVSRLVYSILIKGVINILITPYIRMLSSDWLMKGVFFFYQFLVFSAFPPLPGYFIQIYPVSEGYLRKIPVERRGKYPEPL
jgi:hypothetical protein